MLMDAKAKQASEMTKATGPRERLLETASKLFYEQGYKATGINQLIREADIAKASFYDHFSDKEGLYLAYLEKQLSEWSSALEKELQKARSEKGEIAAIFSFLELWMKSEGYRGCAFINSASEFPNEGSPVRVSVTRAKDAVRGLIKSILKKHRGDSISKKVLEQLADEIYLLVDGAIVTSQIYQETWPIKRASSIAERVLAEG